MIFIMREEESWLLKALDCMMPSALKRQLTAYLGMIINWSFPFHSERSMQTQASRKILAINNWLDNQKASNFGGFLIEKSLEFYFISVCIKEFELCEMVTCIKCNGNLLAKLAFPLGNFTVPEKSFC